MSSHKEIENDAREVRDLLERTDAMMIEGQVVRKGRSSRTVSQNMSPIPSTPHSTVCLLCTAVCGHTHCLPSVGRAGHRLRGLRLPSCWLSRCWLGMSRAWLLGCLALCLSGRGWAIDALSMGKPLPSRNGDGNGDRSHGPVALDLAKTLLSKKSGRGGCWSLGFLLLLLRR